MIEVVVGIGTVYTSLQISVFDDLTATLVRLRRVKLIFEPFPSTCQGSHEISVGIILPGVSNHFNSTLKGAGS